MAVKHQKILDNPQHKAFIEEQLQLRTSYKEISEVLKQQGFSISHTAIMNYDKDFKIKEIANSTPDKDFKINWGDIGRQATKMDFEALGALAKNSVCMQVIALAEKQKNGMATSKDLDLVQKTIDTYKNALDLLSYLDIEKENKNERAEHRQRVKQLEAKNNAYF